MNIYDGGSRLTPVDNLEISDFFYSEYPKAASIDGSFWILGVPDKLNERYAYRRDYVCELLDKKDVWTADMIDEFKNRLLYRYDDAEALNILNRVIWGNYLDKKSINKRPLTKLTRDILNCNE